MPEYGKGVEKELENINDLQSALAEFKQIKESWTSKEGSSTSLFYKGVLILLIQLAKLLRLTFASVLPSPAVCESD